jgi:hypothetical protein
MHKRKKRERKERGVVFPLPRVFSRRQRERWKG